MMLNFRRSQSGIVLVSAVIFLVMLTTVGVALFSSSNFGLKLSGAAAMKTLSRQAVFGAVDEVVDQGTRGVINGASNLANLPPNFDAPIVTTDAETTANLAVLNDASGQVIKTCPRLEQGWSVESVSCQSARVAAAHNFASGRTEHPRSQAESLVFQMYLDTNNN